LLVEEFSNKPEVTKRVCHGALQHSLDCCRANCLVLMFNDRVSLDGTCGHSALVYGDGIIYEKLDPHSGKTRGRWAARAVVGRLVGQEEFRAVNGKTGDDMAAGIQVPQEFRADGAW
jgi:hypothetical protein